MRSLITGIDSPLSTYRHHGARTDKETTPPGRIHPDSAGFSSAEFGMIFAV